MNGLICIYILVSFFCINFLQLNFFTNQRQFSNNYYSLGNPFSFTGGCINVGTVPQFKMQHIVTVPVFEMHNIHGLYGKIKFSRDASFLYFSPQAHITPKLPILLE